mmetsp:Transcript_37591/g.101923  ORF Transcript_37591/g.101923 Transcript_37591/m.101923 type:complete len:95 (+) Transcript_37591:325-609(+)
MPKKGTGGFEKGRLFIFFRIVFPEMGALGPDEIATLKSVLPGPDSAPSYDPDEVEEYTTEQVDIKEFGKRDPNEQGAYDSDEEDGERGVQCQQG